VVVDLTIKTIKRVSGQIVSGPTYKTKAYVIFFSFRSEQKPIHLQKETGSMASMRQSKPKICLKKKEKALALKKTKQIKTKA
jgi:hypothetical protein